MARIFRIVGSTIFALLALFGTAWAGTALWLHLTGALRLAALAALVMALVVAVVARRRARPLGWAALAIAALAVAGWYQTIVPRHDRDWAPDVARGVRADVSGDHLTLHDVRDFDWITRDTAQERWITTRYDLEQLQTVDMLTSVWDNPDIAHLLVSFGFSDGQHVVFSVEIRREADEVFSEVGGFFHQFELVLIAATERDIVKLRTNHRKEQVSLYPIDLTPQQRRDFFMAYVTLAQRLEARPEFYNTLTANCTTVVYALAKTVNPDLPMDRRIVLSGRLPAFIDELGLLAGDSPLEDRQRDALITPRAQNAEEGDKFSDVIRNID
ncbi:DUF4105 domain-containing protein [Pseudohalocynthiibacter aestuariivivens]|nr:DUF4105 domain-containing protein [Pseudohalocynthiibacter aestuariivivens]QIE46094.1 DUF4105 domain-containing protein [Pseudohalocynthiibacter aestuariivivens]